MKVMALAALAVLIGLQDEQEEVQTAAGKIVEAANYSFKGSVLVDMPSWGGGEEDTEPEPSKFSGKHDKDKGSHILTESQEIVKFMDRTATRPRGDWEVQEEDTGENQARRWGGRGMMGRMFSGSFSLPHEDLKGFGEKLDTVDKTDESKKIGDAETTLYKIAFTQDAAMSFFPQNRMMDRMQDAEFEATGQLWIDGEGNLVRYEIKATLFAAFGPNEFEVGFARTVTFSKVGSTELKLPKGAVEAIKKQESD